MTELDLDDFGAEVEPPTASRRDDDDDCMPGERPKGALVQWANFGSNESIGNEETFPGLVPGMFTFRENHDSRIIFKKLPINVDDLIRFPDGVTDRVLNEIEAFWTRGENFKRHGFLHRRGYLFYGPQGSGKSSIVQQVIKDIIDRQGVVFIGSDPRMLNKALQTFRQIEKDRQVVCIFEDIDAIIKDKGEDEVLSLLDGENQIDKVLNIATTNYPERLDKRIIARPRRFDRVLKIDMPNEAVRRTYFAHKLKEEDDLDMWVRESDSLSFASLAEAVISVKCLGNSFKDTMSTLKAMSKANVSSDDFKEKAGFRKT